MAHSGVVWDLYAVRSVDDGHITWNVPFYCRSYTYARQPQRLWKTAARQVPQAGKKIIFCMARSDKNLPPPCPALPIFESFSAHHMGNTAILPCWIFQYGSDSQIFHPRLVLGVALSKSVYRILPMRWWIQWIAEGIVSKKQSSPCKLFCFSRFILKKVICGSFPPLRLPV